MIIVRHPSLAQGGGQLVATLAGATDLNIADIAFSRDGSHALAVGTLPGFGLAVWRPPTAPTTQAGRPRPP